MTHLVRETGIKEKSNLLGVGDVDILDLEKHALECAPRVT